MSLPTFVLDQPFGVDETVTLGEEAAHHMRVRRLDVGARVGLLDGAGCRGEGMLLTLAKRHATVQVASVEVVDAAPAVHLLLPVADRDRMLLLAEKVTELEVSSWRPVLFRRSRHVTPRGEGPPVHQKVAHRIGSA
ncbi:MAG: RNA methyltransferase PUA domain-containing protein, partial [Gemmatimonadaceae bacterium]